LSLLDNKKILFFTHQKKLSFLF